MDEYKEGLGSVVTLMDSISAGRIIKIKIDFIIVLKLYDFISLFVLFQILDSILSYLNSYKLYFNK